MGILILFKNVSSASSCWRRNNSKNGRCLVWALCSFYCKWKNSVLLFYYYEYSVFKYKCLEKKMKHRFCKFSKNIWKRSFLTLLGSSLGDLFKAQSNGKYNSSYMSHIIWLIINKRHQIYFKNLQILRKISSINCPTLRERNATCN